MKRKSVDDADLEAEIARLPDLDLSELRARWKKLFGHPAPKSLRRKFLAKAVAYQMRVEVYGGLSPVVRRRLREIADAVRRGDVDAVLGSPGIKRGTQMIRQWKDKTLTVIALDDGFEFEGRDFFVPLGDRQSDHRDQLEWLCVLWDQTNGAVEQERGRSEEAERRDQS